MRTIIYTIVAIICFATSITAQNNKQIKGKGTITIYENGQPKEYVFDVDTSLILEGMTMNEFLESMRLSDQMTNDTSKNEKLKVEEQDDTVTIKIGGTTMHVVESENGSVITFDDNGDDDGKHTEWNWETGCKNKRFNGHYGLMEFGVNTFTDPDYTDYAGNENFMDLDHNRSSEFNLNLFWQSIPLQKRKGNIGLVTGLGFSWNNYFFAKDVTLEQGDDRIEPVYPLDVDPNYGSIEKTKLVASYLTMPLLLEFQVNTASEPFYVQVGGIGGIKLGSHTKVKHDGKKDKDFSDFYLVPFRYGATARIGYGAVYLYANYFFSEMFKDGRGPAMNPYTVGIGFPAF